LRGVKEYYQQSESSAQIRGQYFRTAICVEGGPMLFETAFSAGTIATFPDNTLCLTFDDGQAETNSPDSEPGPHSLELAQYLQSVGVQATFFMVGRQIQEFSGIAHHWGFTLMTI
jgi:hypothetical protein